MPNFSFVQNAECEYFPCHKIEDEDKTKFNCLFCYCPLSPFEDCGGEYKMLGNGWKDCSDCIRPHFDYAWVVNSLVEHHIKQMLEKEALS